MASRIRVQSPSMRRSPKRNVIGIWSIIVAALPIAATEFGLIPIHDSQRRMLPASAAFFCLLGFAYVFSLRHGLARTMFGARLLWADGTSPLTGPTQRASINYLLASLILASIGAAAIYLWAFETGRASPTFPALPRSSADAVVLALSYTATFVLAEIAFAIMAVREYLQDVLALSDGEVITGVPVDEPQLVANPAADLGLAAMTYRVSPPTSGDSDLAQFDAEGATAGGPARRGFLRRIRMTLARGE